MISIIIPTCAQDTRYIEPCLQSVIQNTDLKKAEIIVVANGASEAVYRAVRKFNGQVKMIVNKNRVGFARAINTGIKNAKGNYLVLLNDDTKILAPNWLELLQEPFSNPKVGLTGPHMLFNGDIEFKFLVFHCAMISRKVTDKIGLLDVAFEVGSGEDIDFCMRAAQAGFELVQVGETWSDATLPANQLAGNFPMWHEGEATVHTLPEWSEVYAKNSKLLYNKYGKKKTIVICPFSRILPNGKPNPKNYSYWADVVAALKPKYRLVQIGVEGEQDLGCHEFLKNRHLKEIRTLIEGCTSWISVETFLTHFAYLLNKPGVVIWNVGDPAIFGYKENINLFKNEKYFRANPFDILENRTDSYDPEGHIDPSKVIEAIEGLLESK